MPSKINKQWGNEKGTFYFKKSRKKYSGYYFLFLSSIPLFFVCYFYMDSGFDLSGTFYILFLFFLILLNTGLGFTLTKRIKILELDKSKLLVNDLVLPLSYRSELLFILFPYFYDFFVSEISYSDIEGMHIKMRSGFFSKSDHILIKLKNRTYYGERNFIFNLHYFEKNDVGLIIDNFKSLGFIK